jgi:hypothetical protein
MIFFHLQELFIPHHLPKLQNWALAFCLLSDFYSFTLKTKGGNHE